MVQIVYALFTVFVLQFTIITGNYEPTWESLDSRPLPNWYDEAKLGIFIHWGVFSVQSFSSEWAWWNWRQNLSQTFIQYIENTYPKSFTYQDFAKDFTAELYNPDQWAKIIHSSGAKYVVITSKHHEGYAMWPSRYSFSWNSMDVGPHRDLIGELKAAVEKYPDMNFGIYHSLYEWYNPLYLADKASNFSNLNAHNFVNSKIIPEMVELIENYKPHVLWSDGEWEAPSSYWDSTNFLAWLYNESPVRETIVVNDRWGQDTLCKHGGFMTCLDRYNPGVLQKRKWENAMSIDGRSWGYRRTASLDDYLSIHQILGNLSSTVSCGGNLLLNIGPTKDGIIIPIYEERLRQLGEWMAVNGEAIYNSKPWKVCQNDTKTPGIWYTTNKEKTILYAMFSPWPENNKLKLTCPQVTLQTKVNMLGHPDNLQKDADIDESHYRTQSSASSSLSKRRPLKSHFKCKNRWKSEDARSGLYGVMYLASQQFVEVMLPDKAKIHSKWMWTLKIEGAKNVHFRTKYEETFEDGIAVTKANEIDL